MVLYNNQYEHTYHEHTEYQHYQAITTEIQVRFFFLHIPILIHLYQKQRSDLIDVRRAMTRNGAYVHHAHTYHRQYNDYAVVSEI